MVITEELRKQIEARIGQLEAEQRDTKARIDELQTLLIEEEPYRVDPSVHPDRAYFVPKDRSAEKVIVPNEGHVYGMIGGKGFRLSRSTTDPEVFGINPYKTYTSRAVVDIWKGKNGYWYGELAKARSRKKLAFTPGPKRAFTYKGEDLIRWRQGIEKKGK